MKLFKNLGSASTKKKEAKPIFLQRGDIIQVEDRTYRLESIEPNRENLVLFCISMQKE